MNVNGSPKGQFQGINDNTWQTFLSYSLYNDLWINENTEYHMH